MIKKIEVERDIRILHAEKTMEGICYIYVRPLKDYIAVFPKYEGEEAFDEGEAYIGVDLKAYLAEWPDMDEGAYDGTEIYNTRQWEYVQKQLAEVAYEDEEAAVQKKINQLFWEVVSGRVGFEVITSRSRMSDFIYERVPDAEIEIVNDFGEHLFIYGYKARAYESYGILDISWLDHDFDSGEVALEDHQVESYDDFLDALTSPYAELFLDLQDMLYKALDEDMHPEEEEETEEVDVDEIEYPDYGEYSYIPGMYAYEDEV